VTGKLPPETEKPVPEIESELIVTATVPLDVTVTDFVTAVPTDTLPNDSDVAFRVRAGVAALSCRETACEVLPVVAVSVTDCALVTEAAFAVNVAVAAPAGTDTLAGTVTTLLLLARETLTPPVGADPDKLTVHESASDPVIVLLLQPTALTFGNTDEPVALRLTIAAGALLEMVNCPLAVFAVVGSNWTVNTIDCPGFRVAGKVPPETENPEPEIESELIVTARVPMDVTVRVFVTAVFRETLPNDSDVALRLNAGTAAFSCIA
jgi:hypothetical protein